MSAWDSGETYEHAIHVLIKQYPFRNPADRGEGTVDRTETITKIYSNIESTKKRKLKN